MLLLSITVGLALKHWELLNSTSGSDTDTGEMLGGTGIKVESEDIGEPTNIGEIGGEDMFLQNDNDNNAAARYFVVKHKTMFNKQKYKYFHYHCGKYNSMIVY